jgi:hypothetical protein
MADPRVTSARFSITIDGQAACVPTLVTGGDAYADVVEVDIGAEGLVDKRVGGVHYRDIDVTCAMDVAPVMQEWISSTLTRRYVPKSGSVGILDANNAERLSLAFENALLNEVAFPALDGAAKDAALLHLRITPERVRRTPGSGVVAPPPRSQGTLVSSFRLEIAGLVTNRVSRIEPFSVRVDMQEDPLGERREPVRTPGKLSVSDLVVTLSEIDVDPWARWHEDFVINGKNDASQERTGTLRLLGADLKTAMVELTLQGLGIYSLTSLPVTRTGGPATVQAAMYCQRVSIGFGK